MPNRVLEPAGRAHRGAPPALVAPSSEPAPPIQPNLERLQRLLGKVAAVFDLEQVLALPADQDAVVEYYTRSRPLYRSVHSAAGAIHMALSEDGRFRADDYYAQARRVEAVLVARGAKRVLELGCGTGFNSAYLAARHPDVELVAIDITPAHIEEAEQHARELPNLRVLRADFHQLPWADRSFDLVFEVEAVCHVRDLDRMMREAFRVLAPGGQLVMFDGCRRSDFHAMPQLVTLASRLIEQSMAIQTELVLDDCMHSLAAAGFGLREQHDITSLALPTIERLQRKAALFFFWPWLARQLLRWNPAFVNTLAVYLMPETIRAGAHVYLHTVMERPALCQRAPLTC